MNLHVVYASDDNYARYMGISMYSLLVNNNEYFDRIHVYVLDNGIGNKNRSRLNKQISKFSSAEISFHDISHKINEIKPKHETGWPVSIFGRYFIDDIAEESVDRLLYLDCDTIVNNPLNDLVATDIEDYCAAGFGIEEMEKELREVFRFPDISDDENLRILDLVRNTNSVSIHARRSDLLFVNGHCYKFGFFKRAVKYIKKHVENPVFVFFTDENSVGWCEENEKIFGLDFKKDRVEFVTWNKGENSFRDMQLMTECKHNIFTESSFGFWGAFLNPNPEKITCAPDVAMVSTHTF